MPTHATKPKTKFATVADVQERVGHIPESRIRLFPQPGTATVQDLLDDSVTGGRLCELVDGILVEKTMGFREGGLGLWIGTLINFYLMENNVGYAAGADGMVRFKLDLVRLPDVSFIRWDSVDDPDAIENPAGAFLEYPPDLAVEVLSPSNSQRQMESKLEGDAKAGGKLFWYINPQRKEVAGSPRAT